MSEWQEARARAEANLDHAHVALNVACSGVLFGIVIADGSLLCIDGFIMKTLTTCFVTR